MAGNRSWGSPSSRSSARIRSVPKPSAGHGLSDSTQRVALCNVLRQLLAFGGDGFGRCIRDELLVREHPLGPVDLLLHPRALGFDVARAVLGRTHDGLEDPLRVARQLGTNAAPPIDARRGLRS